MNRGAYTGGKNTAGVILFACALVMTALAGCGGGSSSSGQSPSGSVEGSRFTFIWPDGYSYDSSSNALTGPSTKLQSSAPSYVTGATITFSQPGMTPITLDIPLSTGVVIVVIPTGTYTIDVVVTTNIGLTFTATQTVDLFPGFNNLAFNMNVNAPPTITSVTASSTSPAVGDTITLNCSATDLDPDDTLTYSWSGSATGSGQSISYHVNGAGSATFTCQVSDGHGGTDTGSVTINGRVASYTTTMSDDVVFPFGGDAVSFFDKWKLDVQVGDTITITCSSSAKLFDSSTTNPCFNNPLQQGSAMTWTAGQANYWLTIEFPLGVYIGGNPAYTCTMTSGAPATATQVSDDFPC